MTLSWYHWKALSIYFRDQTSMPNLILGQDVATVAGEKRLVERNGRLLDRPLVVDFSDTEFASRRHENLENVMPTLPLKFSKVH